MLKNLLHSLLTRLLLLSLVMGISLAAPAYAGGNDNNQGDNKQGDNNQGNEDQGGRGPTIPEPSGWLAMGVGLLVVGSYLRGRRQVQR